MKLRARLLFSLALIFTCAPLCAPVDVGCARAEVASSSKKVYVCPPCGLDCDNKTFEKPGVCPDCGMTLVERSVAKPVESQRVTVAIMLFNGVEIIDYSGPWEIFGAVGFQVHTVAASSGPIRTAFGQRVIPDYTLENCPKTDILLVPGGGIQKAVNHAHLIQWIRSRSQESQHVMSVCNGAFFLAKAGLLDGLSSTTIRSSLDRLAKVAPKTKVVRDRRYVDNGKIITTAGLSAGMDGALHLVAKIRGKDIARTTASQLEYKWDSESD
ncbi:MAG TPA: DJ-1/PfpI family protein [Planctomycetaceae bacterium]|jgi:transcriptional regulator GlxA family with amidase domain|nr:DJ-1/PfpI family protein [Planctomycetaceae bacterium]